MTTFQIRTHNPWKLFVAMLAPIVIPIWLFKGTHSSTLLEFVIPIIGFYGMMAFFYNFITDKIEVVISDKGVKTKWTSFPFFSNFYKEVLWQDIKYWRFSEGSWVCFFSIKTHDNETLYIRCLVINSRQKQFDLFMENFLEQVKIYNGKDNDASNDIQGAPSFFETTTARVFALAFTIFLAWFTNKLSTKTISNVDSLLLFKAIVMYLFIIIYVGIVITFYFLKRRIK